MNTKRPQRLAFTGIAATAALLVTASCSSHSSSGHIAGNINDDVDWLNNATFTSYSSCGEALDSLQSNALDTVEIAKEHADERGSLTELPGLAETGAVDEESASAPDEGATGDEFSETNIAEEGVDEPDVVKTDGDRIYALVANTLQIVDVESEKVESTIDFVDANANYSDAGMFLEGDSIMVMHQERDAYEIRPQGAIDGHELVVNKIDVSGEPRLEDQLRFDGGLLDARMVDGQARIVASSEPYFGIHDDDLEDYGPFDVDEQFNVLEDAIADTSIENWLPTYQVNGEDMQVPCQGIAHPDRYTGLSMLTLLTLPVGDGYFGSGSPVSIAAEADTVYGTSDSIYMVNGKVNAARFIPQFRDEDAEDTTEIYRFTYHDAGLPLYAGDTVVDGYLVNQYSLNEHNGYLRVATTEGDPWATEWDSNADASESTLTVFELGEDDMRPVGSVTGLGPEEKIYSVRFIDDMAYIVTFRETDPLYTIDVSDPTNPTVTGDLDITGYSSYLHPVGEDMLLGVGQEATLDGRTTGTLVSLFDISGDEAVVTDQYHVENSRTAVEHDPHAFLYWEPRDMVTLPISEWSGGRSEYMSVLEIDGDSLTEATTITPEVVNDQNQRWQRDMTMRSIVIGDNLWTLSTAGAVSTDLDSYESQSQLEWNRDQ